MTGHKALRLPMLLPMLLLVLLLASGCATTDNSQQASDDQGQQSNDGEQQAGQQNGDDQQEAEPEFLDDDTKVESFRHPRVATSQQTRHFVRSFIGEVDLPALKSCHRQVIEVSTEANTRPVFLKNLRELKDRIETEPHLHHRCFYYSLTQLDSMLAKRRFGDDFEKVHLAFFARIRAAALLATGLGQYLETQQYVDFLRSRYIEMSYSYFGRKVVPGDVTLPRRFPASKVRGRQKARKPAKEWSPAD